MSKIQFNELNQNASELEVLNETETTEVVGGFWGGFNVSSNDFSMRTNVALVDGSNQAVISQYGFGNNAQFSQGSVISVNQG